MLHFRCLNSRILSFAPYPLIVEHSEDELSEFIQLQLLESGFQKEDLENCIFVSDELFSMQGK